MDNTIISVFGRKGSGKTELVKRSVQEHARVVVLDTLGEYPFEVVTGFDACLAALEAAEERPRFRLSLRCADLQDMLELAGVVYELTNICLVVEETSFYCSSSALPDELSQLVRYGRHRQIDQFYVSRRPAEIARDLTAQSDLIVSFTQSEPRDLDYLARVAGRDVSALRTLPRYRVCAWGDLSKAPLAVLEAMVTPAQGDMFTPPKKLLDNGGEVGEPSGQ